MKRLVALALPPGPSYIDAIRRAWDAGDAVAPIDQRLPPGETQAVLDVLGPDVIVDSDGPHRQPGQRGRSDQADGHPEDSLEAGDALVMATSGTSGRPKAVVHTHESIAASAWATSAALEVDPDRDRWLACLPLAHIGGLSVVLRSMVSDTPVEIHPEFDASAAIDAARRGATLVSLVTRALNQVSAELFRTILVGGAAPPPDRPTNVLATYGMTESGSGVVYDDGRRSILLDGVELSIGPPTADGNPTIGTPDADDEIHIRGPMLFRAYRIPGRAEQRPFDANGWFATGDLGRWGPDDRLVVAGRRGDVIVTGGEKVWPEPVERVIGARDDVAEVAVVGRPDPEWGQRVTAVLVAAGPTGPSLAAVRETVQSELPVWAAPKAIEFVSALPRTALGKVRRSAL